MYFNKMLYLKRKRSFLGKELSLVIVPTMSCNFKCPYCYEHELSSGCMSEEVQDKLIDFINKQQQKCDSLSIYWHGGEPLLAIETMKSLINKIKSSSKLPLKNQSMVSNGYLFNKDICEFFKNYHIDYVQITVDGLRETHNVNRLHKSGVPTYDTIINNIDLILNELPDTHVGVRMNIHQGNQNEYHLSYKELSKKWDGKNCSIYPAFVLPQGQKEGKCCTVPCLSPAQKANFYIDLHKKFNLGVDFMPKMQVGSCSAIYENHYVIDPKGLLYKCWADIGIESRAVGDISTGITKWDFVAAYSVGSDKFDDEKCRKCKIFPICDGGCNRFRVDYQLFGEKYDLCQIDNDGLVKYLEILYEQQINEKK